MIYQRRTSRHSAQIARSQHAVRLGLAVYAALCAAALLRGAVLLLHFPETVWTVRAILTVSSPLVAPFRLPPAANRVVVGNATLADLTALLVLIAIPLLVMGRRSRPSPP